MGRFGCVQGILGRHEIKVPLVDNQGHIRFGTNQSGVAMQQSNARTRQNTVGYRIIFWAFVQFPKTN